MFIFKILSLILAKKVWVLTVFYLIGSQALDVCPQAWYILGEPAEVFRLNKVAFYANSPRLRQKGLPGGSSLAGRPKANALQRVLTPEGLKSIKHASHNFNKVYCFPYIGSNGFALPN